MTKTIHSSLILLEAAILAACLNFSPAVASESSQLPSGVKETYINDCNGLNIHCFTAGDPNKPLVLLLHGMPETAFVGRAIGSLKQGPRSWQRERRDDVDESFDPDARPNQPNARRDFLR